MATKHDSECLRKAGDDEPIFVLRAQDILAPEVVERWAKRFRAKHHLPVLYLGVLMDYEWDSQESEDKYRSAIRTAHAMREWQNRKVPD